MTILNFRLFRFGPINCHEILSKKEGKHKKINHSKVKKLGELFLGWASQIPIMVGPKIMSHSFYTYFSYQNKAYENTRENTQGTRNA